MRVEGAPGAYVSVVSDGGKPAFPAKLVTAGRFQHRFTLPGGAHWVRAEVYGNDVQEQRTELCGGGGTTYCGNRILALAMTSALYLGTG